MEQWLQIRPWFKQPGELIDKKGVPIYPGDLLRSHHFYGVRNKEHFLYHVAVYIGGAMRMYPASSLEPTLENRGGKCLMTQELADKCEVIYGHGPGDVLDYSDRKKVKREETK